ncbi:CBS domain-containing protein [Desulfonatronovibrio magnus]|uniref:CBS domain-containing protein n=1 Tax=Desulfonatronovibrio magnus TaxID=698827 RepID=UPI0005EBAFC0|nr:CBS domain-containing protein [Desulfonatronovibrio magnus]
MLKVSDIMTRDVFTLKETDNLALARSVMHLARIRHIPIVSDSNVFIGLLTHRDILDATVSKLADVDSQTQEEIDRGIPVMEIMNIKVKTISSGETLKNAATVLLEHKFGCLPVVDDNQLVGIITEADFLSLTINLLDALDDDPQA